MPPVVWHDRTARVAIGTAAADASVEPPSAARLISSCSCESLTYACSATSVSPMRIEPVVGTLRERGVRLSLVHP